MDRITATVPEPSSVFHEIGTGEKPQTVNTLSPRATRYGFVPITPVHGLPSTAFRMHTLPASRVIPFRVFPFPLTNESGQNFTQERTPLEQVGDLYAVAGDKFATDFPELAQLQDEGLARQIVGYLTNPSKCEKYPYELDNTCATCWIDYLRTYAPSTIATAYADNELVFNTAAATLKKLLTSLEDATSAARTNVDVALRDVDDPKMGKDRFYDVDYINIWNTHQDMPQFRTSTSPQDATKELTKALTSVLASRDAPGITADDVRAIVAESSAAKDARILELEARLAEFPPAVTIGEQSASATGMTFTAVDATPPTSTFDVGDPVTVNGQQGKLADKRFGRYKVEFADGSAQTVDPNDLRGAEDVLQS